MKKTKLLALFLVAVMVIFTFIGCNKVEVDTTNEIPTLSQDATGSGGLSSGQEDLGTPFGVATQLSDTAFAGEFDPETMTTLETPVVYEEVGLTMREGLVVPEQVNGREVEKIEYFQMKVFEFEDGSGHDWMTEVHDFVPGDTLVFIHGEELELDKDGEELHLTYTIYFKD